MLLKSERFPHARNHFIQSPIMVRPSGVAASTLATRRFPRKPLTTVMLWLMARVCRPCMIRLCCRPAAPALPRRRGETASGVPRLHICCRSCRPAAPALPRRRGETASRDPSLALLCPARPAASELPRRRGETTSGRRVRMIQVLRAPWLQSNASRVAALSPPVAGGPTLCFRRISIQLRMFCAAPGTLFRSRG